MGTITTDLTGVDLKGYGVKGELPRLLERVADLRARERAAWQARAQAKEDVQTVGRRMAYAEAQALRDGTDSPDTSTMPSEADEALEVAQARLDATTLVRQEEEAAVVRYLRDEAHAERAQVAQVVEERHAAATSALAQAQAAVDELLAATGVLEAMAPGPSARKLDQITPPARSKLHAALRDVVAQVDAVSWPPLPALDDEATA